uniref:Uncharacterized protein n=1 Tax=Lactuca sativa TaxID=4236 RepID=A0A9R1UNG7_LACSA|nr:hypothetical protein LSAT_V11C800447610 [Lactuca sativa]
MTNLLFLWPIKLGDRKLSTTGTLSIDYTIEDLWGVWQHLIFYLLNSKKTLNFSDLALYLKKKARSFPFCPKAYSLSSVLFHETTSSSLLTISDDLQPSASTLATGRSPPPLEPFPAPPLLRPPSPLSSSITTSGTAVRYRLLRPLSPLISSTTTSESASAFLESMVLIFANGKLMISSALGLLNRLMCCNECIIGRFEDTS